MNWVGKQPFQLIKFIFVNLIFGLIFVACTTSSNPTVSEGDGNFTASIYQAGKGVLPSPTATLIPATPTAVSPTSTPIIEQTPTRTIVVEPTPEKPEQPLLAERPKLTIADERVSRLDILYAEPEIGFG